MSPLDLELCETLGELVLVKSAKDWTDLPTIGGEAVSKGLKKTRSKARAVGRSSKELATDPLFLGSAVGGASLGALLVRKLQKRIVDNAAPKEAMFRGIGSAADWMLNKGFGAVRPAASLLGRGAAKLPGKVYNVAMEAGGIRGLSNEAALLKQLRGRGSQRAWNTVRDMAKAKGHKNPVTAFKTLFSPMETLSPRFTEAGYARHLLTELKDPVKLKQFMVNATPAQRAAMKKMSPFFAKAEAAGHTSLMGKLAPIGIIGGPVAYNLAKGGDDPTQRPVVSSPHPGFQQPAPVEPNMIEKFWGGAGDRISKVAPGIGNAIGQHPYLSTAGAAGLTGAGLYGLFGGRGNQP